MNDSERSNIFFFDFAFAEGNTEFLKKGLNTELIITLFVKPTPFTKSGKLSDLGFTILAHHLKNA
jgi:hypothetical protein